jgi:autotransporter-associated beta strand protein
LNFNGGRFAPGTLRLSGANTFSGGLTVQTTGNRTILEINNAAALGTGTLTLTGGSAASGNDSIRINNLTGSALTLSTNNAQDWDTNFIFGMDLNGNGTGSSLNMGTGAVSLGSTSATASRTVNVHSNTLTVGGVISNGTTTNSLTKTGSATMVLTGANDYTGDTTVSAGTLTLGDTGEFRMVIQDANASNRLLGTSNLNLNGILRLDISGLTDSTGTWNLVDVASLNESFGATFGLAFVGGPSFTDNLDGTYSSGGWTFETLDGNLTLVPEPSTFAMLLGGLGMLIGFRRIARRRA